MGVLCSSLALLALLAACKYQPAASDAQQTLRLQASFEQYRFANSSSIEEENRLISETLGWLNGAAVTAPRAQALADARRLMDRWARVYFVPRQMHGQLRSESYSSTCVSAAQERLLACLKRRYFALHDYQRYAQRAAETGMHDARSGDLTAELKEFKNRLERRAVAVDELFPMLDGLGAECGSNRNHRNHRGVIQ